MIFYYYVNVYVYVELNIMLYLEEYFWNKDKYIVCLRI